MAREFVDNTMEWSVEMDGTRASLTLRFFEGHIVLRAPMDIDELRRMAAVLGFVADQIDEVSGEITQNLLAGVLNGASPGDDAEAGDAR